jgi:hypothetical protein
LQFLSADKLSFPDLLIGDIHHNAVDMKLEPFRTIRRLERMNFKLTANVNSSKLSKFVKKVKDWEAARSAQSTSAQLFTALQFVR